jgi:hypothetical protein
MFTSSVIVQIKEPSSSFSSSSPWTRVQSSRSLQKLCSSFPIFWLKPLRGMRVLWLIVYRPIGFTLDDHLLAIVGAMQLITGRAGNNGSVGTRLRGPVRCSRGQHCAYFAETEVSDYWTASSSIWEMHDPRTGRKGRCTSSREARFLAASNSSAVGEVGILVAIRCLVHRNKRSQA